MQLKWSLKNLQLNLTSVFAIFVQVEVASKISGETFLEVRKFGVLYLISCDPATLSTFYVSNIWGCAHGFGKPTLALNNKNSADLRKLREWSPEPSWDSYSEPM